MNKILRVLYNSEVEAYQAQCDVCGEISAMYTAELINSCGYPVPTYANHFCTQSN